jgi:hypothetical protein
MPECLLPSVLIRDLPLDKNLDPHIVIQRFSIRLLVAETSLLLNRPLFARALKEHPEDPSLSKFAPNFVALYESSEELVHLVKQLVVFHPSLIARWWVHTALHLVALLTSLRWFFWFHAFSAAVCL